MNSGIICQKKTDKRKERVCEERVSLGKTKFTMPVGCEGGIV